MDDYSWMPGTSVESETLQMLRKGFVNWAGLEATPLAWVGQGWFRKILQNRKASLHSKQLWAMFILSKRFLRGGLVFILRHRKSFTSPHGRLFSTPQHQELRVEDLRNRAVFNRLMLILETHQVFLSSVITTKLNFSDFARFYGHII